MPQVAFTGQYFKCYRGDLEGVSLPENKFVVTDDKEREWVCFHIAKN